MCSSVIYIYTCEYIHISRTAQPIPEVGRHILSRDYHHTEIIVIVRQQDHNDRLDIELNRFFYLLMNRIYLLLLLDHVV